MSQPKAILWAIHYVNDKHITPIRRQYILETSPGVSYEQLCNFIFESLSHGKAQEITYARGEGLPNVIINNDTSLALAIEYYEETGFTKEIPLNVSFFY